MMDIDQENLRIEIENRITQKKGVFAAPEVLQNINKAIAKYPELDPRERDFAFRYSMEHRTQPGWANYYNCSVWVIRRMLENPRVQMLISEIQSDVRSYTLGMSMFLLREALDQYLRIFRYKEDNVDVLETKRKTADKIVEYFCQDKGKEKQSPTPLEANFNFTINSEDRKAQLKSHATIPAIDVDSVEINSDTVQAELDKLRQLEDLREQAKRYIPNEEEEKRVK